MNNSFVLDNSGGSNNQDENNGQGNDGNTPN